MKIKRKKINNALVKNTFKPPNSIVVLEKLGQMFKRMVIRDCYMTKDKFGQVKGKNKGILIKPNNFVEQNVYIQNIKEVTSMSKNKTKATNADQRKREKEIKARKLKWPDVKKHKQLKGISYRVKFEELKKGRPRAVFLPEEQDCKNLRNHVILKKLQMRDNNLMQKVQSFALVFKVKQAEFFYMQEIKPFLKSRYTAGHLETLNNALLDAIEDNDLGGARKIRGGDDKSEFRLGMYKNLGRLQENTIDNHKKLFATRIDAHLDVLDELGGIDPTALGRSPFSEFDKPLPEDAREMAIEIIKNTKGVFRVDGLQADDPGYNYLRIVISNCVVVVRLEKMILENKGEDAKTKSIYSVKIKNVGSKEKEESVSNSYKSIENKSYTTFETDSSILCPGETLNDVQVTVTDLFSGDIVVDKTCALMDLLERVHMENTVYENFFFGELNGDAEKKEREPEEFESKIKGVLVFNVVLFPNNLEIAHLLCPGDTLEKQFSIFEKAVKSITDFHSYRNNFFQAIVRKNKQSASSGRDLFYYRNKFIEKQHFSVQFQDDSMAACQRYRNLFWIKDVLGRVLSSEKIDIQVLASDNIPRLDNDTMLGDDLIFDLYIRAALLYSPAERVVLNSILFQVTNMKFMENSDFKIHHEMEMSRNLLRTINRDLLVFFDKMDYLTRTQQEAIRNITHRVFFLLDTNKIHDKLCRIHYSQHYVPMIASIVLVNQTDVTDKDMVTMSINAILGTTDVGNYTYTNHINYLSNAVSYFKFLFKKLYPEQYIELTKFLVEFDIILAGFLLNSFAGIFDHVNFNIYMDIKVLFEVLFSVNDVNIKLISKLKAFGLRLSTFVDIMFLLQSFAAMFEKFKYATEPNQIRLSMESILIKQMQTSELTIKQILQLVEYIFAENFFESEYVTFKDGITETHLKNATEFMLLKTTLRKADLKEDVLKDIIKEQLVKNNVFCLRLQSIYKNSGFEDEEEGDNKMKTHHNKNDNKLADSGYNNFDSVDEDIFFEVAEEGADPYEDLDNANKNTEGLRYLTCMVYLNNMDMALLESISNQHKLKANLNNVFELNQDEFEDMVSKYVNITSDAIPRLFQSLVQLSQSPRVPVLKFIILLILSVTEDFEKTAEHLSHLIFTLSSIIYREVASLDPSSNKDAPFEVKDIIKELNKPTGKLEHEEKIHFSEIVKYVITEVSSMTPFNLFNFFVERMVDVQHPQVAIEIKHAKLHLGPQVIDITELCIRHHVTSTYTEGRPCLLFNDIFNDWMTDIFATLLSENQIDESCSKFDIFLEVYIANRIRHYRIPFRIVHVPEILVFCKQNHRIYFDRKFDENCLFPKSTFIDLFRQLPYNFLDSVQTSKIQTHFFNSDRKLILTFNVDTKQITRVDVSFKNIDLENACDLQPWAFKNTNPNQLFTISTDKVSLNVSYTVLFLPIKDMIYHVVQSLLLNVQEVDFFKFIKMNLKFLDLSTVTNKKIDGELMLSELKEYEKAVNTNNDINLKINISTKDLKF